VDGAASCLSWHVYASFILSLRRRGPVKKHLIASIRHVVSAGCWDPGFESERRIDGLFGTDSTGAVLVLDCNWARLGWAVGVHTHQGSICLGGSWSGLDPFDARTCFWKRVWGKGRFCAVRRAATGSCPVLSTMGVIAPSDALFSVSITIMGITLQDSEITLSDAFHAC
jgi:hypothetical protein